MIGGSALKAAADALVDKARPLAAHLMEAAPADVVFKEGKFQVVGTDRSMALVDVAKAFYRPVGLPKQFGIGLEANGAWSAEPQASCPNRLGVKRLAASRAEDIDVASPSAREMKKTRAKVPRGISTS